MKFVKYRIIRDNYLGYECQIWKLWWPFWTPMGIVTNTHPSIEKAKEYIERSRNKVVWSE